jgi:serine/threonine-protein phosphatase 5
MEEYGEAIADATQAISEDPKYAKGYYRRGAAYLSLSKFREALQDFREVTRQNPKSKDAKNKLNDCKKAIREVEFREAIES